MAMVNAEVEMREAGGMVGRLHARLLKVAICSYVRMCVCE